MPKKGDNFYQNIKTVVMKMRYAVEDILLLLALKKKSLTNKFTLQRHVPFKQAIQYYQTFILAWLASKKGAKRLRIIILR